MLPLGVGGIPCSAGVGSRVGSLRQLGGGASVPLRFQCVCGFFTVRFCQERHPAEWF